MPINAIRVHSIYGEMDLPDTSPQVVPLIVDGETLSEVPVPEGRLIISDAFFNRGFIYWSIEVNRGRGYSPLATFGFVLSTPIHTEVKNFSTGIVIEGGPGVFFRVRATAVGATPIPEANLTLRAYTES